MTSGFGWGKGWGKGGGGKPACMGSGDYGLGLRVQRFGSSVRGSEVRLLLVGIERYVVTSLLQKWTRSSSP